MFVPFQAPLTAKAAEYCTDSNLLVNTSFRKLDHVCDRLHHNNQDEEKHTIYTVGPRHFFEGILT